MLTFGSTFEIQVEIGVGVGVGVYYHSDNRGYPPPVQGKGPLLFDDRPHGVQHALVLIGALLLNPSGMKV